MYLRAKITNYEDHAGTIYYDCSMKLGDDEDGSSWTITKRFSQFVELQKNLKIKYSDLPELPPTSWFKVTDTNTIEERKIGLNDYMQTLCKKEYISTDSDFNNFINLEENSHNKIQFNKEK